MRIDKLIKISLAAVAFLPGVVAASDEAAKIASEQGIFSGSLADAWWTVIAFGLLIVLLGKFAWRPMLNGLKSRQEHISNQISSAESTRKQAEKLLADYNKKMEQLEAQGQEIIKKVTAKAEEEGRILAEKARQEAAAIKAKAQEDIEHARRLATEQIWGEVGDVVLALGAEVLKKRLGKEDNDRMIQEAISRLKQQKATART